MLEDSDEESSDLNIESKTWKKLEKNMKTIGFLEGVEEGNKLSLQEGFSLGYSDGFKLGHHFGLLKGMTCCDSKLQLPLTQESNFNEKALPSLLDQKCWICSTKKSSEVVYQSKVSEETNQDLLKTQQNYINQMIAALQLHLESYKEKG